MDSAYRPERRVKPPTGRLFPNDLLQLQPVGRRRLGDVQLTHCPPFELFFFYFFFKNFFTSTVAVGQGTGPESPKTAGYVVPCPRRAHLTDPWVAPAAIRRSSDEILRHHEQGGRHKRWSPRCHQSCRPRTSLRTSVPAHHLLFGLSTIFDVRHVTGRG